MRIALVTMIDDNFVIGYEAFMTSLLINNPWFNYDMVIIDLGLSEASKATIAKYYQNVKYLEPKRGNYRGVNFSATAPSLQNTYYKLEIFRLYEYDRVVFMDMDMVVDGDIMELFSCDAPFAAVQGYDSKNDALRADINSGVFVVNKAYLNPDTYAQLIKISERGFSMPDQKAINIYFKGKIHHLPKVYNVEKRMLHTIKFRDVLQNAKVIHFVATNPWDDHSTKNEIENSYAAIEAKWFEYYHKRGEHGKDINT